MLKISVLFSPDKELRLPFKEQRKKALTEVAGKVVEDLKIETPVDTGNARDHWSHTQTSNAETFSVENSVDYIVYLNRGHSDQAPSHFIEKTVLKYGEPSGPVVEEKEAP